VDAAFVVHHRDNNVGGNLMACAVAYRLFVWLLPASLIVAACLGFLRTDRNEPAEVAGRFGLSAYVASSVTEASEQAHSSRWIILALGLWGTYTASAAAAKTFSAIHGIVWDLPVRRPRHTAAGAAAFAGIAIGGLAVVLGAYELRRRSPGFGLGLTVAIAAAVAGMWLLTSFLLPHGPVGWTRLIPGAIGFALGFQALHLFSVYYLAGRVASSSELYGGLGAAASVLLWLYLIGRLVVASAVINATLWQRSGGRGVERAEPSSPVGTGPTDGTTQAG
jgi:uncharacterized BrkB/YihY/UPF0761 family membrane protein